MQHGLVLKVLRQPDVMTSLSLVEWDLLLRQARRANVLARIYALAEEFGIFDSISPHPREHLGWSRYTSDRHAQAVEWEVTLIQKALASVGVPVVLLKGAAYVMAKLPPAKGRIFADIDIIVPRASLSAVEASLMLHGWATTLDDEYDQRYYRTWMHELPPMQHIQRMTVIDVHHAILPDTAWVHPDTSKLLADAIPVEGYGELKVLSPVDMVLHSAAHLFHEGELEQGLRDLVDLDSLLRHFSATPGFWPHLVLRARELELTRPLFYATRYTARFLQTPIPSQALDDIAAYRPPALTLALMDALYSRALMPNHPSCSDWFTVPARQALYIRANWLRMPPLLLAKHLFHKAFISPGDK
jgi:hypothetical protein